MNSEILHVAILVSFLVVGAFLYLRDRRRFAFDVLEDLRDESLELKDDLLLLESHRAPADIKAENEIRSLSGYVFHDDLANAGLIEEKERADFLYKRKIAPLITCFCVLLLSFLFLESTPTIIVCSAVIGACLGYIGGGVALDKKKEKYKKQIEFFLPVVMERLVMAVQAGLDILPAVGAAVKESEYVVVSKKNDPVTKLLTIVYKLTESGLSFERSLKDVASVVDHSAVRHAFTHLAVAQKEGGELVMPLRELSDSTQLYFQESVEEEIAKMPVKATMPLLLTFAGLLLCFLAPPIIQLIETINTQAKL
ncbi:MAG: type II secretion system F family protein [Deltaproteobacteria bacterium]|nr:type II secretion system F family protein [Deltaproteobacteria bacterium]